MSNDLRTSASNRSKTANSSSPRIPLPRKHFRGRIRRRTPSTDPAALSPGRRAGRRTTPPHDVTSGGAPGRDATRRAAGIGHRAGHAPPSPSSMPSAMPPTRWPTGCRRDAGRSLRPLPTRSTETRRHIAGTFDEQVDRRSGFQRSHRPHLLVGDPESLTAGGQHLHRRRLSRESLRPDRPRHRGRARSCRTPEAGLCLRARRPPTP